MTITPHLLIGAAVAKATTNSLPVAFLIGFLLHFLLDPLPHTDPGTFFNIKEEEDLPAGEAGRPWPLWIYIFAVSEFILIWLFVIILFKNRPDFGIIMMGGLGAIFVDVLDNNPLRFMRHWPIIRQIHWLHNKLHFELKSNQWYWGLPIQIILIGISLWVLLK